MVELKREQRKKDGKALTVLKLCVITFSITFFFGKRENLGRSNDAQRSKTGNSLRGQKNYATPANEDFGQTSNWSKLVAAYLPVARLTILDRLVSLSLYGTSIPRKYSIFIQQLHLFHFISERFFPKTDETESLVVRP